MNKQQLASKIWASTNKMRSKIEANEYKDYILGFIFYKFLSDKEVAFLKANDWDASSMKEYLYEDKVPETVEQCRRNLGQGGHYDELYATLNKGRASDFLQQLNGGQPVPPFLVAAKADKLLRDFIVRGGFDIDELT